MLEPVYALLLRHRAETQLRSKYVYLNQEGRPIDLNTLRRRIWYPALKRAGIRFRNPNQTRHTFATLTLATGENREWIAKQLGHASTQMLFQRYTKFIPNVSHRDGAAFLKAYQGWFAGEGRGAVEQIYATRDGMARRPLGAFYATPQKRGQANRLTP
jgi:integrase